MVPRSARVRCWGYPPASGRLAAPYSTTPKNGYAMAGQSGRVVAFHDELPEELVVLLEMDVSHPFMVRLPFPVWTPRERTAVLEKFFTNSPDNYAAVVDVLDGERNTHRAVIVNAESGEFRFWTGELRATGMPVYWGPAGDRAVGVELRCRVFEPRRCI
jgi:hypothetical protein